MPIERIEELCYGVEDLSACSKFLNDMGYARISEGSEVPSFKTPENQIISLRVIDDPNLPTAIEDGSTLRELTWGVSSEADLDQLESDLGTISTRSEGTLRVIDPNGLALAFRVTDRETAKTVYRPHNQNADINRMNDTIPSYGDPKPMRIIHVALNITKANNAAALAFYTGPLRFKATDKILDTGTFLQSEGDIEHHNFFLCFRPDQNGINHFATEVYDLDAVIEAGNSMIENGWKESRRLGRHKIGSNAFRFVHAPFGGRIEFVADMDRNDKSFETRVWDKNPGHHIWMLKSSGTDPIPQ